MIRSRLTGLFAALLLLVACEGDNSGRSPEPEPTPTPVRGGSLVFGVYGEPATLDPYSALASDLTYALVRPLYRSLYRFTPEGEAVPDLVRSLDVSGDVATVVLGPGSWSDGSPITARDVEATIARARPPSGLAEIDSVDVQGRRRLVLIGSVEDWATTLGRVSFILPSSGEQVYSGPFVLARSVPGLQLVYRPNLAFGEPPYLERLIVQFTEGTGILLGLLEQRDIDAAWIPSTVNLEERLNEIDVQHDAALGWESVQLDLEGSDLTAAQIRHLARTLDRRELKEGFVRDDGRIANTNAPEPGGGGADGTYGRLFRGSPKGKGAPLLLAAPSGDELLDLAQRLIQVQLDSNGYDVELVTIDARRHYGDWARDDPMDAALRRVAGAPGVSDEQKTELDRLPLLQVEDVVAWTGEVAGISANPTYEGPLWNAHEWFLPVGHQ